MSFFFLFFFGYLLGIWRLRSLYLVLVLLGWFWFSFYFLGLFLFFPLWWWLMEVFSKIESLSLWVLVYIYIIYVFFLGFWFSFSFIILSLLLSQKLNKPTTLTGFRSLETKFCGWHLSFFFFFFLYWVSFLSTSSRLDFTSSSFSWEVKSRVFWSGPFFFFSFSLKFWSSCLK